jgi:PAT family beta-lactamase induction signal transducer AmpG
VTAHRRGPNPFLYFILFLPFGATSGFVSVALGFVGSKHGLSTTQIADLVAISLAPQTYKFLWAPVNDMVWTRKGWYITATLVSAVTLVAMGFVPVRPDNLGTLMVLVYVNSVASTLVAMSTESIMAHATPLEERGRAAGWSQAGNLGGSGVAGGAGLALILAFDRPWIGCAILGVLLSLCTLALIPLPEPAKEVGSVKHRLRQVFVDLFSVIWSRNGAIALALCFLPMGAGALTGLFSGIHGAWGASEHMVEIMNGWVGGIVGAVGCLIGGRLSDAMNRKGAYALAGAILAAFTVIMVLFERTPLTFTVLVVGYNLATGLAYGCFTGFVLEIIGGGAAATKYNTFAALSNFPIWYMGKLDGRVADHFGMTKMMLFDAGAGFAGLVLLLGVVFLTLKLAGRGASATAA